MVTSGRRCLAIEVKAAARFTEGDLSGLRAFRGKASDLVASVLAYNGTDAVSLGDGLYAVPLGLLLA